MSRMERPPLAADAAPPPWIARNPRDRQAMECWVIARLDDLDAAERQRQADNFPPVVPPEHAEKYDKWRREGGLEFEAAKRGVIVPARDLVRTVFPLLADLVQLPPLKRGEKYRPEHAGIRTFGELRHRWRIDSAAKDVARIREVWQSHYGKRNRRPADGPSAVEIAAKRHDVSFKEVELRLKNFSRDKSHIS